MPIEKEVNDLMSVESKVRQSFVDLNRRAGPIMSNKVKKQLESQLSNGFGNFGHVFGQSFGSDFAKSFNNLSKNPNKHHSMSGQSFKRPSIQRFVSRRANIPQTIKNIIKYF